MFFEVSCLMDIIILFISSLGLTSYLTRAQERTLDKKPFFS